MNIFIVFITCLKYSCFQQLNFKMFVSEIDYYTQTIMNRNFNHLYDQMKAVGGVIQKAQHYLSLGKDVLTIIIQEDNKEFPNPQDPPLVQFHHLSESLRAAKRSNQSSLHLLKQYEKEGKKMNSAEVKEMKEIQILSKKNGQIICKAVLQLLELFPYIEDHKDGLQTTPETTIAIEYYKPMI